MYELRQTAENSFYIDSPARCGLYRLNDQEVVLIDAGNDKNAGRKIRQILDQNHWKLKAIYNTHSNADHIGGNEYLQKQTGCRIFAPATESAFTCFPELEPAFLYGGFPFKELRNKFLMAKPSNCRPLEPEDLPEGFEMIPLPGHFFNMHGYRTPDNIIFLADCLFSKETLDKYQIFFIYDVKAFLDTLDIVKTLGADLFIPAHNPPLETIDELAEENRKKIYETADCIVSICKEPKTFEEILKDVFDHFRLEMTFDQYVLIGSTVRSYLSWLKDENRLSAEIKDNRLLWQAEKPE